MPEPLTYVGVWNIAFHPSGAIVHESRTRFIFRRHLEVWWRAMFHIKMIHTNASRGTPQACPYKNLIDNFYETVASASIFASSVLSSLERELCSAMTVRLSCPVSLSRATAMMRPFSSQ